jgi:hypothetical protein
MWHSSPPDSGSGPSELVAHQFSRIAARLNGRDAPAKPGAQTGPFLACPALVANSNRVSFVSDTSIQTRERYLGRQQRIEPSSTTESASNLKAEWSGTGPSWRQYA